MTTYITNKGYFGGLVSRIFTYEFSSSKTMILKQNVAVYIYFLYIFFNKAALLLLESVSKA